MTFDIEGCIYPRCNGGIDCPLESPPELCEADLSEDDKEIMELEKKVAEGKEAQKELARLKQKVRFKLWQEDHKDERREYLRKQYHIRKDRQKGATNEQH